MLHAQGSLHSGMGAAICNGLRPSMTAPASPSRTRSRSNSPTRTWSQVAVSMDSRPDSASAIQVLEKHCTDLLALWKKVE
eukprot:7375192-Prymnesium_polylepis.1